jgi:hypothetical protein
MKFCGLLRNIPLPFLLFLFGIFGGELVRLRSAESPYLYGIHDHDPDPSEYLSHITNATGVGGWVTATVAVGANTNDLSGANFSALANAGHTVICRINYGYFPDGTIPLPAKYDDFAIRIRNFVANSSGCTIWLIGNELNLSAEWPFDGARFNYVSPQSYADCFRKAYDAIKSVRPNDKVLPQASAPWGGPYGSGTQHVNGTNYPSDGQPLSWVQYQHQVLSAITNSGSLDGIALHIGSRGYHFADIHSTNKFGSLNLYSSFYVYKDWIDYGIPPELYSLPLYVTECNGLYYWKGGGPPGEDPSQHYEPGWMQEIYAEINRYNQLAATTGKPIFRCFNMYRWCAFCDGWNVDGGSNPYKAQILADLDAAAAQKYAWPAYVASTNPPPAPTNLTAVVGNGNIQLAWSATPFANSYHVKRATVSGGPYTVVATNVVSTSFIHTSFTPGTTYYYCVSALNAFGQSTNSAQVAATPTNGLPDVVVTAISWTPAGTLFAPTNVVFRATVLNQGSAATPSGVTLGVGFLVDGAQVSWAGGFSSPLAPGSSVLLTADGGPLGINYWTATAGSRTITANVDDIDRFPEGNEANNILQRTLAAYVRNYFVNSGGGIVSPFAADAFWSGSTNTYSVTNIIDVTGLSNAAPQAVYQTERWGGFTYTFENLVPSTNYTVRLHFAEISPSVVTNGDRRFHVALNGTQVLTNLDILATAGGKFRGLIRQFTTFPDASGRIVIQFTTGASNEPKVSGIEIAPTPALPPLKIVAVTATNGLVSIRWQSYAGKTYRVEFKEDLSATNWNTLGPEILAQSNTVTQSDLPVAARRFYRVVQTN